AVSAALGSIAGAQPRGGPSSSPRDLKIWIGEERLNERQRRGIVSKAKRVHQIDADPRLRMLEIGRERGGAPGGELGKVLSRVVAQPGLVERVDDRIERRGRQRCRRKAASEQQPFGALAVQRDVDYGRVLRIRK